MLKNRYFISNSGAFSFIKVSHIMTRSGRRLVEDFLLPALNDGRYGERLQWVDKSNLFFSIRWNHKNAAKWTLEDTVVFQDWDKLKGHFHPAMKGYYMQAKQRFRAALYKLNTVRKVCSQDKHVKVYQLVLGNEKRGNGDSPVHQQKTKWERGIPTSVICQNTNYVAPKMTSDWQDTSRSGTDSKDWQEQGDSITKEDYEHSISVSSPYSNIHSNEASSDSFGTKSAEGQECEVKEKEQTREEVAKPIHNNRHVLVPIMPSYLSSYRRVSVTPVNMPPAPLTTSPGPFSLVRWYPPHQETTACFEHVSVCIDEQLKNGDSSHIEEQGDEALNLSTKPKSYKNSCISVR